MLAFTAYCILGRPKSPAPANEDVLSIMHAMWEKFHVVMVLRRGRCGRLLFNACEVSFACTVKLMLHTNRFLFWESIFAGCFSLYRSLSLLLVSICLFVSHSVCLSVYLRLHTSLTIPQPSLENSKHETHILTDFCFCESVVSLSLGL